LVTLVLQRVRIDLLRNRLLSVTLTCFCADLLTGNAYLLKFLFNNPGYPVRAGGLF
jgi:hypothetical protein